MADTYDITFPGLEQRTGNATVTLSSGTAPGVVTIEVSASNAGAPSRGNVVITKNGVAVFTLYDCVLDSPAYNNAVGATWTARILDRRWKWNKGGGYISGRYNVRRADDTIDPATFRSPRDLVDLLLDALGETGYDSSAAAVTIADPPEVWWDHVRPVDALSALLNVLGLRLVLRNAPGNPVRILVPGEGAELPDAFVTTDNASIEGLSVPQAIALIGGPTVIEGLLELEAVGKDTDGKWKLIDELSYAPAGGWQKEHPDFFWGVEGGSDAETLKLRTLARQTVFRAYRVKRQGDGSTVVPGLNINVANAWQYQLQDRLLQRVERDDGVVQWSAPEVYGVFWGRKWSIENEEFNTRYDGDFAIDQNEGIVLFGFPMQRKNAADGEFGPAELYLRCAYTVLDPTHRVPLRHVQEKLIAADSPAGVRPFYRFDVYRTVTINYDSSGGGYSVVSVGDDLNDTQLIADAYLNAEAAKLLPRLASDRTYSRFIAIELDGAIQQVTYSLSRGLLFTRASRNSEHSIVVPSAKARDRVQKIEKVAVDSEPIDAGIPPARKSAAPTPGASPGSGSAAAYAAPPPIAAASDRQVPVEQNTRWTVCKNVASATDIPPFAPFRIATDPDGATSAEKTVVLKVVPLTDPDDQASDDSQAIGFAGPNGIAAGHTGVGTFDSPCVARCESGIDPGATIYAGTDSLYLVKDAPDTTLTELWPLHKVRTIGSEEDWIVAALAPTGSCNEVDEYYVSGAANGGYIDITYTLPDVHNDPPGADIEDTVRLDWDMTRAQFQTALEGHAGIEPGDVLVVGGPWPHVSLHVIWQQPFKTVPFPTAIDQQLTAGAGTAVGHMRKSSSKNWKGYV